MLFAEGSSLDLTCGHICTCSPQCLHPEKSQVPCGELAALRISGPQLGVTGYLEWG